MNEGMLVGGNLLLVLSKSNKIFERRKRRTVKKIGMICLVLVLALGVLGVGYARWAENLYIDGTVTTGDIGAEWSIDGDPWDDEAKEISYGTIEIIGDTLYIDIYEAYPCVTYHFPIDIHCTGSVPIHLGAIQIDSGNLPPNTRLEVIPPTMGVQLHYCDSWVGELIVHLDNDAVEDTTYSFTASLEYAQYNEP
jgi:hypothetical protein